jgi:hypothetical protein
MKIHETATIILGIALLTTLPVAGSDYTLVTIPATDSIQTDLVSTFPTGLFQADDNFKTPFKIPAKPATCGYAGTGPCNFYDGWGSSGSGQTITMSVSIPNPTLVYTLMNALTPPAGQQLATIEFVGSQGTTETFPLVAGQNIRDFYHGSYANTLKNGIPGVTAVNAFTCVAPSACLGGDGTGDVNTGAAGTYVIDEQQFALSAAFASQSLVQIVITDTYNGAEPLLLGITVASATSNPPVIKGFSPAIGGVGATVTIGGDNFTGATAVTFNGVSASYTVETALQIKATVPAGATTGPIQVTTSNGTATSQTNFTVALKSWNAVNDFSITSNPYGVWSYGYATSFGGTFTLLAATQNPCVTSPLVCWWDGDALPLSATVLYNPGPGAVSFNNVVLPHNMLDIDGEEYEIIVRWTAPASGSYAIEGSFNGVGATGCGQSSVNVGVYQDVTTALAQGNISSYGQQYAFSIPSAVLAAGTTIDFTGALTNTPYCDGVGLIATVYRVSP